MFARASLDSGLTTKVSRVQVNKILIVEKRKVVKLKKSCIGLKIFCDKKINNKENILKIVWNEFVVRFGKKKLASS